MSTRKLVMLTAVLPSLLAIMVGMGWYDIYRWGMYFNAYRDVVPVSFYGKLVDERGEPIAEADIAVEVVTWNWAFIFGAERHKVARIYRLQTDVLGRFQLIDSSGYSVQIKEVKKPGYAFKPGKRDGGWDTGFYFSGGGVGRAGPHKPDPSKPYVFHMEKQSKR